jgi:hypothetical protein
MDEEDRYGTYDGNRNLQSALSKTHIRDFGQIGVLSHNVEFDLADDWQEWCKWWWYKKDNRYRYYY